MDSHGKFGYKQVEIGFFGTVVADDSVEDVYKALDACVGFYETVLYEVVYGEG